MLPPIIPLSAAPVTSQLDPVKPTPDIKPVVPAQPTSSESGIDLKHQRDPQEQVLLLREEQRRQQQRRKQATRIATVPCQVTRSTLTTPCRSPR